MEKFWHLQYSMDRIVQFSPLRYIRTYKLVSRKLHLATHKEHLKLKNVVETTFCQWKANVTLISMIIFESAVLEKKD